MTPHPKLDQLEVFVTVVEQGSFSAASRVLHRSQPVISYTIANLETQLGMTLFLRGKTRRPQLTDAGRSVLEDARRMLADLDRMRARVRALTEGLEGDLGIAFTALVPMDFVVEVLHAFHHQFPTVSLHVTVGTLGVVMDALTSGRATVGFGGTMSTAGDRIVFDRIGSSRMVPVAAPTHPLGAFGRQLDPEDVRNHTQLVVYDASGLTKGRDFNVFSLRTWRVSDNATKLLFIRGGLGWGGLAQSWVQKDLDNGQLARLDFPAFGSGDSPIYAIHHTARPPGPAARWLVSELRAKLSRPA